MWSGMSWKKPPSDIRIDFMLLHAWKKYDVRLTLYIRAVPPLSGQNIRDLGLISHNRYVLLIRVSVHNRSVSLTSKEVVTLKSSMLTQMMCNQFGFSTRNIYYGIPETWLILGVLLGLTGEQCLIAFYVACCTTCVTARFLSTLALYFSETTAPNSSSTAGDTSLIYPRVQ